MKLNNPFISLIEKKEDFKTVWFRDRHGSWKYEKNMTKLKNERLWLSIIHAKNKVNRFSGYGNVKKTKLYPFHISGKRAAEIFDQMDSFKTWRLLSFKNRIKFTFKRHYKDFKGFIGLYNKTKD